MCLMGVLGCSLVYSSAPKCSRVLSCSVGSRRVPSLFVFSRRVQTTLLVTVLQFWCRFLNTTTTLPAPTIVNTSFVGRRCHDAAVVNHGQECACQATLMVHVWTPQESTL